VGQRLELGLTESAHRRMRFYGCRRLGPLRSHPHDRWVGLQAGFQTIALMKPANAAEISVMPGQSRPILLAVVGHAILAVIARLMVVKPF